MFVDLDTGNPIEGTRLHYGAVNITFTAEQLEDNHRYEVNVTVFNANGSNTSEILISK